MQPLTSCLGALWCVSEVVKGTIGLNLLGHHRGSVLQGIDRAVQEMALGEKARVNVRYDARGAEGECWGPKGGDKHGQC